MSESGFRYALRGKENTMTKSTTTHKIGRDAKTGEFMPVRDAQRRPATTTVETIRRPVPSPSKSKK